MRWYDPVYAGLALRGREERIRGMVEKGEALPGLYLITLAANHTDLLDIRPADSVLRMEPEDVPLIVGIAMGKTEAVSVVERMLGDCVRKTGSADVRLLFTAA